MVCVCEHALAAKVGFLFRRRFWSRQVYHGSREGAPLLPPGPMSGGENPRTQACAPSWVEELLFLDCCTLLPMTHVPHSAMHCACKAEVRLDLDSGGRTLVAFWQSAGGAQATELTECMPLAHCHSCKRSGILIAE